MSAPYILLVEDNPDDEELTLLSLRKHDASQRVVVVRDGVAAVDFLWCRGPHAGRDPGSMPAVVLLDLKLPKLDGLGVLKQLRSEERTRYLPVVIMTSSGQESDSVASYRLGANGYVRKPVEFGEYVQVVGSVGTYWTLANLANCPPPTV